MSQIPPYQYGLMMAAKLGLQPPYNITEQPSQNPRASFIGIPSEIRLRIYGYVVNGGRVMKLCVLGDDCPKVGYGDMEEGPRLKCCCTQAVWPSILGVNKLVFTEAMPVLYSTTDFHVRFPALDVELRQMQYHKLAISALPKYGLPHIRRIVLTAKLSDMTNAVCQGDTDMDDLSSYWAWLRSLQLNLCQIRLCILASGMQALTCFYVDIGAFVGLMSISRASQIVVQVPADIFDDVFDSEADDDMIDYVNDDSILKRNQLRNKIVKALHAATKHSTYPVEIIDISNVWLKPRSKKDMARRRFKSDDKQIGACRLARELHGGSLSRR